MLKLCGWVLLLFGVALIFWTLYSSYNIFTGEAATPEIFKIEEEAISQKSGTQDIQEQMKEMIGEQLKELIPAYTFSTLLNLIIWGLLAGILIFGGAQISNLGIKLIKE